MYSDLVGAWFEIESAVLRAHADALVRRAEVERVDDMSLIELARILDSIESSFAFLDSDRLSFLTLNSNQFSFLMLE